MIAGDLASDVDAQLAEALERIETLEAKVAALCQAVGIAEVPAEAPEGTDELDSTWLARGFGRYRKKVHALEDERRRS